MGNIFEKGEIHLNYIIEVKGFDVWDIDFMEPLPSFGGNKCILMTINYISKWVEAIASLTTDATIVAQFFKRVIFSRYGLTRVLISDGGTYYIEKKFEALLKNYEVHHKVGLGYHPKLADKSRFSILRSSLF